MILRGNGRQAIFFDDEDRCRWERWLRKGLERHAHRIHLYCWMTNHVHMAIQAGDRPLGGFMGFVASQYARATNRKLGRCGHLFERRYRAILVQEDCYLMELVRYIQFNPVRAGLASDPANYPWSSHHAYLGQPGPDWLTTDGVLSLFGKTEAVARRQYARFMQQAPSDDMVQKFRTSARDHDRVLGDAAWEREILKDADDEPPSDTLDELVRRICLRHNVSEQALMSRVKCRKYAIIRAEIALEAVEQHIATTVAVARRFGRNPSVLSRAMARLRKKRAVKS